MAEKKTNAMRLLDANKIPYHVMTYDSSDGKIDGIAVAEKVGKNPKYVYKTLVTQGNSKGIYVFVIPVEKELDLKKAAKTVGEKKVEMIPVKDIQKWTGYIRGGCSPIGMKKIYPTVVDQTASALETIVISGGKIGIQVETTLEALKNLIQIEFADIIK